MNVETVSQRATSRPVIGVAMSMPHENAIAEAVASAEEYYGHETRQELPDEVKEAARALTRGFVESCPGYTPGKGRINDAARGALLQLAIEEYASGNGAAWAAILINSRIGKVMDSFPDPGEVLDRNEMWDRMTRMMAAGNSSIIKDWRSLPAGKLEYLQRRFDAYVKKACGRALGKAGLSPDPISPDPGDGETDGGTIAEREACPEPLIVEHSAAWFDDVGEFLVFAENVLGSESYDWVRDTYLAENTEHDNALSSRLRRLRDRLFAAWLIAMLPRLRNASGKHEAFSDDLSELVAMAHSKLAGDDRGQSETADGEDAATSSTPRTFNRQKMVLWEILEDKLRAYRGAENV